MTMESELLERVERWAKESPTKSILTFVDDKGTVVASVTCADLHRKMHNLAALLLATPNQHAKGLGLKAGDRVLLVYPPGLDFIIAFLACLRAGVVAVPVYPPDPRKMKKDINMFAAVAQSCQAQVALTSSVYYNVKKISDLKQKLTFSAQLPWPEHLQWIVTEDLVEMKGLGPTEKNLWLQPLDAPHASDLAFLQYTSGSTSAPKGVMLTHGNLNHNLRTISSALLASRETIVVSWLPQYHDMGLIGAYLGTIFNGGTGIYLSPFSFIKDPMLWLRLISKYRATHLQAPNFAYALCARKADQLNEQLDLSCVRHMINGAEPIQGEVMDKFYKAFTRYGLPPDVIKPTYGLAEHTVYVCGGGQLRVWVDKVALEHDNHFRVVQASDAHAKEMIGCGVPSFKDHRIDLRIVDAETQQEQPEGHVGEIWIASASKAVGYYGADMQTLSREAFHSQINRDDGGDDGGEESDVTAPTKEYLRTGDFGVIYQHELFICGRMKDLVIIRGRNHYPQDIEATAEAHEELRPGCSAAFSFNDGSDDGDAEKLALVAELRDPEIKHKASLCGKIRAAVAKEHGVKVTLVVLLKPRSIPKTTSGKISRSRAKRALEDKMLEVLYRNEDIIGDIPDGSEDTEDQATATTGVPDMEMDRRVMPDAKDAASRSGDKVSSIVTDEPPERVFDFLVTELAQLLGVEKKAVVPSVPLQELGMDSMALTQLQGIITQKYHVHVPEDVLYSEHTTLAVLHATLCGDKSVSAASGSGDPNARLVGGPRAGEIDHARQRKEQKLVCGCIAC